MDLSIRAITRGDLADIVNLVREFSEFEHLSEYFEVTESKLEAAMFGKGSFVEGLIAIDGARPIGYVLFFPNFSSFRGQRGLFLEDIFVNADYRGQGVGKLLLKQVARVAFERGLERIDFLVQENNRKAITFYQMLGAVRDDRERRFKFTDAAFRQLGF